MNCVQSQTTGADRVAVVAGVLLVLALMAFLGWFFNRDGDRDDD